MEWFIKNFQVLLLIFARISGIFWVAPFFSSLMIPSNLRVIFSVLLTIIIYPALNNFNPVIPNNMIEYGLLVIMQILIGLILGFIATIIFTAFQLAGEFFSFQMGFGITEVFDPLAQIEIPIIGQFQYLISILVFLSIRGHHMLISALFNSFEVIPLLDFTNIAKIQILSMTFSKLFSQMFLIALKVAFPIFATMFLVSFILGLLAKASPQLNVFMVGFPIQIAIGLVAYLIVMPLFIEAIRNVIDFTFEELNKFIFVLR
jgi:flagellar biosynthetic protein FliR